jgi:hypothetical protein
VRLLNLVGLARRGSSGTMKSRLNTFSPWSIAAIAERC